MINLRLLAGSLAFLLTASTLVAAPANKIAAKTGDHWIIVPDTFMESRWVAAPGTTRNWRRVIVDVPPTASARRIDPKVTRSCGEKAVDAMAVEFVKTALRYNKKMSANLATHTLGFQLELRPYLPVLKPAQPPPEGVNPKSFLTPHPDYPEYSRVRRNSGLGQFKVTYGPAAGRPREVMTLKTTGDEILDANFVIYALNYWYAPASTAERTKVWEIEYRLR